MAETRDWVVYDLSIGPLDKWAPTRHDEPAWGPMTEAEAKAMASRNPRAYWARQLKPAPKPESATYTIEGLRDPETIVSVLRELGWHMVADDHQPDCPARPQWGDAEDDEEDPSWGFNCNCVPDAATWSAPSDVDKFLGEDWESRLARARARKKD